MGMLTTGAIKKNPVAESKIQVNCFSGWQYWLLIIAQSAKG